MKRTITNPELKETITFLQTAAQSRGAISDLEITLLPGGDNPMHYHTILPTQRNLRLWREN